MPKAHQTPETRQYLVLNPRGIPQGVPVISFSTADLTWHWREKDVFEKPSEMSETSVSAWVARGFLQLMTDGSNK